MTFLMTTYVRAFIEPVAIKDKKSKNSKELLIRGLKLLVLNRDNTTHSLVFQFFFTRVWIASNCSL